MSDARWMVKKPHKGHLFHTFKATQLPTGYWNVKSVCGGVKQYRLWPAFEPDDNSRGEAARELLGRETQGFPVCASCFTSAKKHAKEGWDE